jgi:hypothetical protein
MKIKRFEEIEVWQEARKLVKLVNTNALNKLSLRRNKVTEAIS